jgi:hypothetical protein
MNVAAFTKHRLGRLIAKWSMVLFFAAQLILAVPHLLTAVEPFQTVPNITYVEKMRIQWGGIFDLLDFVRRETPENAVILMKEDGRPEFDQYFLFPRRVVYGTAEALRNDPPIDYVLVDDGYPQFPVSGSKIMMDDTHGLFKLQK